MKVTKTKFILPPCKTAIQENIYLNTEKAPSMATDMLDPLGKTWLFVHEVGHSLGKMTHSKSNTDIMFAYIETVPITDDTWARYVSQVTEEGDPCGDIGAN